MLHFYYKFVFLILGRLGSCCGGGYLSLAFRILLWGIWKEWLAPAPCFERLFFSFEGSFGSTGGRTALGIASSLTFPVFVVSSAYFASLGEVLAAGGFWMGYLDLHLLLRTQSRPKSS